MAFVALAVHRYDLRIEYPEKAFPRMDEAKLTLGIMDSMKADAIMLVFSPGSQAFKSLGLERLDWIALSAIT